MKLVTETELTVCRALNQQLRDREADQAEYIDMLFEAIAWYREQMEKLSEDNRQLVEQIGGKK